MFADQGPELVGKDQSWWARTRVGGLRLNLNGGTSYTCNVHVFVRIRVPNAHLGPSKDETPLLALNPPPTQEGYPSEILPVNILVQEACQKPHDLNFRSGSKRLP